VKKYWNNQIYCECQLVVLWNAAIYYGIKVPDRYGNEYKADCKKAGSIYGSCLNSRHVMKKLHLQPILGSLDWGWIRINCPIGFLVFCHRGHHAVLAIDVNLKEKKILLANYAKERLYWLKFKKLIKIHNKRVQPIKLCQIKNQERLNV